MFDRLGDLSRLTPSGSILLLSSLVIKGLSPPGGALSAFSDKKSADPYVVFEGPFLHTVPAQPQTAVQSRTLNPSWKVRFLILLDLLALLAVLFVLPLLAVVLCSKSSLHVFFIFILSLASASGS